MRLIVDRIEGGFAVCENELREMLDISLSDLPDNCKEGTVIQLIDGCYCLDSKTEKERHSSIKNTIDRLWK